jgi:hypothetical protein
MAVVMIMLMVSGRSGDIDERFESIEARVSALEADARAVCPDSGYVEVADLFSPSVVATPPSLEGGE